VPFPSTAAARLVIAGIVLPVLLLASGVAHATPPSGGFGPAIDDLPRYERQERCSPWAKAGVLAFRNLVLAAFPGTGAGSISRACHVGGTSEHKEGRAWDWPMNAGRASDRRRVSSLMNWLRGQDRHGHDYGMARRTGVMYVIWNRRIWFPGSGWRVYCEQKPRGCVDPRTKELRHPHRDHVHFSFTWAGATKKTTYWNKRRSFVIAAATQSGGNGYWLLGRNGGVIPREASWLGSASGEYLPPAVDIAPTPTGAGYLLVFRDGRVRHFGDAARRGGARSSGKRFSAAAYTPDGKGYWLAARGGRVFNFGRAPKLGGAAGKTRSPIVAIVPTATGQGYWLVARNGRVFALGDAPRHGDVAGKPGQSPIVAAAGSTSGGYWLVSASGRVWEFGPADHHGDLRDRKPNAPVVAISVTPGGSGYRLVTSRGRAFAFGDARR
jgi:hypothetical protein